MQSKVNILIINLKNNGWENGHLIGWASSKPPWCFVYEGSNGYFQR
jgi:hypothetical protein